jgi:hypothetical protein
MIRTPYTGNERIHQTFTRGGRRIIEIYGPNGSIWETTDWFGNPLLGFNEIDQPVYQILRWRR